MSSDGRSAAPFRDLPGCGDAWIPDWKDEAVEVDSIDGDLMLDMRGCSDPCGSPSSSTSVMTARRLDEFGATKSRGSPPAEFAGLEEYCEVGEMVVMLVLAGIVCSASFGESAKVMNEETSGGKTIRLSCRSLLGIGDGRSSFGVGEGDGAEGVLTT